MSGAARVEDGDGVAAARLRREYRRFVRAGHPDVGGDPEVFAAELRRWQELLAPAGPAPAAPPAPGEPQVTFYRRGPWPVRCGRVVVAAVRRRRRTRVR
ncbi:hypothetical protein [Streptomyces capparidis]